MENQTALYLLTCRDMCHIYVNIQIEEGLMFWHAVICLAPRFDLPGTEYFLHLPGGAKSEKDCQECVGYMDMLDNLSKSWLAPRKQLGQQTITLGNMMWQY